MCYLFIVFDELKQMFYSLSLRDIFLYADLLLVERHLARTSTNIAIVGISHFARTIYYTAHDAYLQTLEVLGGSLMLAMVC